MNNQSNAMRQQVLSLPAFARSMVGPLDDMARRSFDDQLAMSLQRVFLVGCGDSHNAALGAELAWESLTGLPCQAMTSMQFARYKAGHLPASGPQTNLVIAVSVSGQVSRTIEAMDMARQAGATAVAITGSPATPLAQTATRVFQTGVAPPPAASGEAAPGVSSYLASQSERNKSDIRGGGASRGLAAAYAERLRDEIRALADAIEGTIDACDEKVGQLADVWADAERFVFVGGGPNYGTALFSAAKVMEASGDPAQAQETEEWAHLQYFVAQADTPTFLLSPAGRDVDRMGEVAQAAKAVGRRVCVVAPAGNQTIGRYADLTLPVAGQTREAFSPAVYSVPGELFAAWRAQVVGATYFRGFAGPRALQGDDSINRVRSSNRITEIMR